ncbi:hypothetical protein E9531_04735 [Lampropedia puyangensis]|uniref:Uncharacterized protein n=1 Tax=Lampropedia puyangensis TaxID=1330072 RepID=A0A4S8FBV5_9BURK|nr:hypothetical protein [Lampropedia puyangensis]THU04034.1 hypothetical protein E9531_04735 [Lampropedia puyangensis]
MPKKISFAGSSSWRSMLCALGIVVLAATAGLVAVLSVVFPFGAMLIGYFLPQWVFISPFWGSLSFGMSLLVIVSGAALAALLIRMALLLSKQAAFQALVRRR